MVNKFQNKLVVSIQYTNVTGRRTDGYRTMANDALCIALRGKKMFRTIVKVFYKWQCKNLGEFSEAYKENYANCGRVTLSAVSRQSLLDQRSNCCII